MNLLFDSIPDIFDGMNELISTGTRLDSVL